MSNSRLKKLEAKVRALYEKKSPRRADWADALYQYHVFVTVKYAAKLAKRYKVDAELAQAGAMLHDIADAVMKRFESGHHEKSLEIAKKFLKECGYSQEEIAILVDDALPNHDCKNAFPKTDVGKILSTADAVAHFDPDYTLYHFCASFRDGMSFDETKARAAKKLDKDYKIKILYPEVKKEVKKQYETLKKLFSK